MSSAFDKLKNKLLVTKKKCKRDVEYLSTGSTLLNLACSDRIHGGFQKGTYVFLVGDSSSGKTFLSLTCLAEASIDRAFDDYRFVYDNAENGALMQIEKFFGRGVAERIEPPRWDGYQGYFSSTVEEMYFHLDDAFGEGKPFIYILDSMDVLSTDEDEGKFLERKGASRTGKEISGSYGTSKAKANSAGIRRLIPKLKASGSILIIISQTRDNLGFGFEKKTRSGGHALRFYASLELWSSIKGKLKKTVKGKERQLGITCEVKVKKNRLTGKERTVEIPIYHSLGIDDLGSCIDYLLEEKYWSKNGAVLHAADFAFKGSRDKLIEWIEENQKEGELRELVGKVWQEIEEQCEVKRKNKYE